MTDNQKRNIHCAKILKQASGWEVSTVPPVLFKTYSMYDIEVLQSLPRESVIAMRYNELLIKTSIYKKIYDCFSLTTHTH